MGRRAAVLALLIAGLAVRLRVAADEPFLGADSVGYLKLAHELRTDGRLALGPPPEPLDWYRRPLYPMFLAALGGQTRAAQVAQSIVDVLAGLLVFACARRLGGPAAGLAALALAMLCPFTLAYSSALLTESLAGALTLAAVSPLILSERPRAWLAGAAAVGLASLLRPEGPLLAVAWLPALAARPAGSRVRLAGAGLAVFALVFAAWPVRNLIHFGTPHLADGMVDRGSHEVQRWRGYWHWLASFGTDARAFTSPPTCYYDPRCFPTLESYDRLGAFADDAERAEVARLFDERRSSGLTAAVDEGFEALARRHRLRAVTTLPLYRLVHLWIDPQDEPFAGGWRPGPSVFRALVRWLRAIQLAILALALGGAIALGRRRETRTAAIVLVTVLAVRSEILAWTGFCLPRYLQPVYGLVFILAGAGAAALIRRLPWARFRPTIDGWTRGDSSSI